jgi:hypothetical protein
MDIWWEDFQILNEMLTVGGFYAKLNVERHVRRLCLSQFCVCDILNEKVQLIFILRNTIKIEV